MQVVVHDLGPEAHRKLCERYQAVIHADGRYAACQGCFACWTRHPRTCYLKDSLQTVSQALGQAGELILITENCYGSYSPKVKTVIDRSIAVNQPLSTYRGGQMHHVLRYGEHALLKVVAYGPATDAERDTLRRLTERNAINNGYRAWDVVFLNRPEEWE